MAHREEGDEVVRLRAQPCLGVECWRAQLGAACETLCRVSPQMLIGASVTLPRTNAPDEGVWLEAFATRLAEEYGLVAAVEVGTCTATVWVRRAVPSMPARAARPPGALQWGCAALARLLRRPPPNRLREVARPPGP